MGLGPGHFAVLVRKCLLNSPFPPNLLDGQPMCAHPTNTETLWRFSSAFQKVPAQCPRFLPR